MFRFVDSLTWRTYSEIFKKGIWTASAFKVIFIVKFHHAYNCNIVSQMSSSKEDKDFGSLFSFLIIQGAFGERMYSANLNRHLLNHLSWLEVMLR
jgi:hypothetical protein